MLKVDIDEPIEAYDESVFAGMNLRNTILSIITIILGGMYFILIFFVFSLPVEVFCYTCWLPGLPVFIIGRKRSDGLSFKMRWEKRKYNIKHSLPYISTECNQIACEKHNFTDKRKEQDNTDDMQTDDIQDVILYLKRMFVFIIIGMIVIIGIVIFFI